MRVQGAVSVFRFAWCLIFGAAVAFGAEVHVDAARGSDALDGADWSTAKRTLAAAFAAAALTPEADIIRVAEGTHVGTLTIPPDTVLEGGHPSGGGARNPEAHPTILDGRGRGPVVAFGSGTDGSSLDGFVIRGGRSLSPTEGGGVTLRATSARLVSCLVELNEAPQGGGVVVDMRGGPFEPVLERCTIRANTARLAGGDGQAGGVLVLADDDAHADHPVIHHGRVIGNRALLAAGSRAIAAGGVLVRGCARLEHVHVLSNDPVGVMLDADAGHGGDLVNCEMSDNGSHGLVVGCGTSVVIDNCTFAGNRAGAVLGAAIRPGSVGSTWSADVTRSILWSNASRGLLSAPDCALAGEIVSDSIVQGGHPGGQNVIDEDPRWIAGPAMDHYLSSTAAGQPVTSPAIDAGPALAQDLALGAFTTRVDSGLDTGLADWGAHCEPGAFEEMDIYTSTEARFMFYHRTVTELPAEESPVRDPQQPLTFWSIPIIGRNEIRLYKDEARDVLIISW